MALSPYWPKSFHGELLLSESFGPFDRNVTSLIRVNVIHARREAKSPIFTIGNSSILFMRYKDIWICSVSKTNVNAVMVFEFMRSLLKIFESYCNCVNEKSLRTNYLVFQEILNEIFECGYPQKTDSDILNLIILQGKEKKKEQEDIGTIASHITGATNWRPEGIKHKKNEVFLDVNEEINLFVSSQGFFIIEVNKMFGLNDTIPLTDTKRDKKKSVEVDDVTFHSCVRINGKTERGISFIPPDGEFELMRYRTSKGIKTPFLVSPLIRNIGSTRIEAKVVVKSMFSETFTAGNFCLILPVPQNCAKVGLITTKGKAKYKAESNAIVWRIKKFSGNKEMQMNAEIEMVATTFHQKSIQTSRAPISLHFQIPMYAASGLTVRYLKVLEPKQNYSAVKWVRYITNAGQFEVRI